MNWSLSKIKLVNFKREISGFKIANISKVDSKFLRVVIESGQASSAAPLGPMLGQIQIPMLEFCDSFNFVTKELYFDFIDLGVQLRKVINFYDYFIKFPRFTYFFHQFYLEYGLNVEDSAYKYYNISVSDLWTLVSFFSVIYNFGFLVSAKIIFGYLNSSIIKITRLKLCFF